ERGYQPARGWEPVRKRSGAVTRLPAAPCPAHAPASGQLLTDERTAVDDLRQCDDVEIAVTVRASALTDNGQARSLAAGIEFEAHRLENAVLHQTIQEPDGKRGQLVHPG